MNIKDKLFRLVIGAPRRSPAKFKGRKRTHDIAYNFRMGAGFPGDVNRFGLPATIEPVLMSPVTPPTAYGQPVIIDTVNGGVRPLVAGDTTVTALYGITVRPFPVQQSSGSNFGAAAIGAAAPLPSGYIDVVRSGYVIVQLGGVLTTAAKGGAVFVWVAASGGGHTQGFFETSNTGGSTINITTANPNTTFNGAADASGVTEVAYNV